MRVSPILSLSSLNVKPEHLRFAASIDIPLRFQLRRRQNPSRTKTSAGISCQEKEIGPEGLTPLVHL